MPNSLFKENLENLYRVFENYKLNNMEEVSCFDYGPTEDELNGISCDVKNIPDEVIGSMEFYGEEWGTVKEVKYFLPRIFDYISGDISHLEEPGCFSFFKYKLADSLKVNSNFFNKKEKEEVKNFTDTIIGFYFSSTLELGYLLEFLLVLGYGADEIHSFYKSTDDFKKKQVISIFNHFECKHYDKNPKPRGVYFHNAQKIKELLDLIFINLNENEIERVIS